MPPAMKHYYAALLPRRGPHIASHSVCLSVCLSVRLSVRPVIVAIGNVFSSTASVTDVLFGTHWGPHIVRPSRPHKFLLLFNMSQPFVISAYHKIKFHFWIPLLVAFCPVPIKCNLYSPFSILFWWTFDNFYDSHRRCRRSLYSCDL